MKMARPKLQINQICRFNANQWRYCPCHPFICTNLTARRIDGLFLRHVIYSVVNLLWLGYGTNFLQSHMWWQLNPLGVLHNYNIHKDENMRERAQKFCSDVIEPWDTIRGKFSKDKKNEHTTNITVIIRIDQEYISKEIVRSSFQFVTWELMRSSSIYCSPRWLFKSYKSINNTYKKVI